MFDLIWWPSVLASIQKLPKETIYAGAVVYVVLEIHRRNANVKIAQANATVEVAKTEAEILKLRLQLNKYGTESP